MTADNEETQEAPCAVPYYVLRGHPPSSSAETALIMLALINAQADLTAVQAKTQNDFYNSTYADLTAIATMVRPVLAKHGLGFSQPIRSSASEAHPNACRVVTRLIHSSGQWMEDDGVPLISDGNSGGRSQAKMQLLGSAVSYARRYGLCAMLGIVTTDEDDDGAGADGDPAGTDLGKVEAQETKPKPVTKPKAKEKPDVKGKGLTGPILTVKELDEEIARVEGMISDCTDPNALHPMRKQADVEALATQLKADRPEAWNNEDEAKPGILQQFKSKFNELTETDEPPSE